MKAMTITYSQRVALEMLELHKSRGEIQHISLTKSSNVISSKYLVEKIKIFGGSKAKKLLPKLTPKFLLPQIFWRP